MLSKLESFFSKLQNLLLHSRIYRSQREGKGGEHKQNFKTLFSVVTCTWECRQMGKTKKEDESDEITWWQLTEEKSTCGFNAAEFLSSKDEIINGDCTILEFRWETYPLRVIATCGCWCHHKDKGGVDLVWGRCGCCSVCRSFSVHLQSSSGVVEAERLPTGSGALHSTNHEVSRC